MPVVDCPSTAGKILWAPTSPVSRELARVGITVVTVLNSSDGGLNINGDVGVEFVPPLAFRIFEFRQLSKLWLGKTLEGGYTVLCRKVEVC